MVAYIPLGITVVICIVVAILLIRRRQWKALVADCVVVVLVACAVATVFSRVGIPLINHPAPVPAAAQVIFTGSTFVNSTLEGRAAIESLNADDGALRWRDPLNIRKRVSLPTPIMSGDAIYVLGSDQTHTALVLYALSSLNGDILWSNTLSSSSQDIVWEDEAGPLLMDGIIYIAVKHNLFSGAPTKTNSTLYALRADSGLIAWSQQLSIAYQSLAGGPTPTIITADAGQVYVNETDGLLHALRAKDAVEVWSASAGVGTMGVSSGVLFQRGPVDQMAVIAVRESDGIKLWTQPFYSIAGMAVAGNRLVAVSMSEEPKAYLTGMNASDSKVSWQYPITSTQGAPVISNGVVYYNDGFTLDAIDIGNGRLIWQEETPDMTYSEIDDLLVSPQTHVVFASTSPYIGEDPFFDPSTCSCLPADKVFALNAQDGSVYWQYQPPSNGNDLGGLQFAVN